MRAKRVVCGAVLALALAAGAGGCKVRRRSETASPQRFRTVVAMSDPRAAGQLVSGFHEVEAGAWRWTERQFAILLARPAQADQRGATLMVKLTVPPPSIEKLKSIQLRATVNGSAVAPETYTAPGDYVYRRVLAPGMLAADPVRVDFSLDKAIPPGNPDLRELGVVVLAIGLEPR